MCQEIVIRLFGRDDCRSFLYEGEDFKIEFNGIKKNEPTYRPCNIPQVLTPKYKDCVKNAFYVGKHYGVKVVEGVIIVRDDLENEAIVQAHCWNIDGLTHFDVTPFIRRPRNITYVPYRNFEWIEYRKIFGGDTSKFTFLSGETILRFERAVRDQIHRQ